MIERYYEKSNVSEAQLQEALAALGSTTWMLEDQVSRWKVVMDGSEWLFDAALQDILAYPDSAMAYEVSYLPTIAGMIGKQSGTVIVTNGKIQKTAKVTNGVDLAKLKEGDLLTLIFERGDRNRPVVIG